MTFKDQEATACFVYITLPGATEAIAAGRFRLLPTRHGATLGRFVYGRRYLDHPQAVEIDPVALPLASRVAVAGPMVLHVASGGAAKYW